MELIPTARAIETLNTFAYHAWLLTYAREHCLLVDCGRVGREQAFGPERCRMVVGTMWQFMTPIHASRKIEG